MSSFGAVLTGGIQDISALLPLLGTEQCEDHVGSALLGGYLYAATAPLSIFGSLGIVRAGTKALAASCSIEMGGRKVMGAEKVYDAGFSQAGKVLSLIMWEGGCHLAEKEFIMRLEQLHITNVAGLTVDADTRAWNLKMLGVSLIAVMASLTPYIYLFKVSDNPFSVRWLLPLARSFGGLATSSLIQIIIQTRLLEIIKHRIVFMTVNDFVRTIDPALLPDQWKIHWNTQVSSEVALHYLKGHLKRYGFDREVGTGLGVGMGIGMRVGIGMRKGVGTDREGVGIMRMLHAKRKNAMKDHSLPMAKRSRLTLAIARIVILLGLGFSVIGYIGSFSLVQTAAPIHALTWLILEITLSLVRIVIWSWNPKGDESTLTFSLKLSHQYPLPTCNKFSEELDEEGIVPLRRSNEFLGEITSFSGLLEPLEGIEEGVALYYAMSVCEASMVRVLYITIFDYKERISRTIKYCPDGSEMTCRTAEVEVEDGEDGISRVRAVMGKEVPIRGNHLTKEQTFVIGLKKHCDSILNWAVPETKQAYSTDNRSHPIKLTWALERGAENQPFVTSLKSIYRSIIKRLGTSQASTNDDHPGSVKVPMGAPPKAPEADMVYLRAGKLERAKRHFCLKRSQWVKECFSLITEETLAELLHTPIDLKRHNVTVLWEAAVAEWLLLYEWNSLELILIHETRELETILLSHNIKILKDLNTSHNVGLEGRISAEQQNNIRQRITTETRGVSQRLTNLGEKARGPIREWRYHGPAEKSLEGHTKSIEESITGAWKKLAGDFEKKSLKDMPQRMQQPRKLKQLDPSEPKAPSGGNSAEPAGNAWPEIERLLDDACARIKKFIDDARGEVEKTARPAKKELRRRKFKELAAMSEKLQKEMNIRLRDECRMMEDRLWRLQVAVDESNNDNFLSECNDFKGSSFVARLALSKNSKYIQLPRHAVQENGPEAIAWALERNAIVSCIDCTECAPAEVIKFICSLKAGCITLLFPNLKFVSQPELSDITEEYVGWEKYLEKLAMILGEHRNILWIDLQPEDKDQDESKACITAIQRNIEDAITKVGTGGAHMLMLYQWVEITDYYRRGNPYLLLGIPGSSACIVLFSPPPGKGSMTDNQVGNMMLRLEQCRASSTRGQVDIYLDGSKLEWDRDACPSDDFGIQDIPVEVPQIAHESSSAHLVCILEIILGDNFSMDRVSFNVQNAHQVHVLKIVLREDAECAHWLADVQLLWP